MTEQEELLVILMEECAEVQQECSKVLRFGDPFNAENLKKEICDLLAMIDLAVDKGMLNLDDAEKLKLAKIDKLRIFSKLDLR